MEEECFICCSKSGKTDQERLLDNMHHSRMWYPLVPLSYAYGCRCTTSWVHNRCLLGVYKCPTCRKQAIPRLRIKGQLEHYVYLDWIRIYPAAFHRLKQFSVISPLLIFMLNWLQELRYLDMPTWLICMMLVTLAINTMILLAYDYTEKYWLFSAKHHLFY